ncbi:S8/S53 family peptidase [Nonomuraea sp. NPDC001636]|uniref:S8/S53 family peptidase n=1 Tax=Nonomuraea sp. NPDC001636 TaxID=3154391 RepID=UPI0033249022
MIGEKADLDLLLARWDEIAAIIGLPDIGAPHMISLSAFARERNLRPLRVIVIKHPPGVAPILISVLQRHASRFGISDLSIDEGFYLRPASQRDVVGNRWAITWTSTHRDDLRKPPIGALPPSFHSPVALVDSGDEGASMQVGYDAYDSDYETPFDNTGHGTSVGSLIRLVAPHAQVDSFRVLDANEVEVDSSLLLAALTELTAEQSGYSIIVVPYRAILPPRDMRGRAVTVRMLQRRRQPVLLVCAAGNVTKGGPVEIDFPATVPGSLVAAALCWDGEKADYNCKAASGHQVRIVYAYGGEPQDGIGAMAKADSAIEILYGTSYAAALIAAALVR